MKRAAQTQVLGLKDERTRGFFELPWWFCMVSQVFLSLRRYPQFDMSGALARIKLKVFHGQRLTVMLSEGKSFFMAAMLVFLRTTPRTCTSFFSSARNLRAAHPAGR
jgi:hypothetical protein